MTKKLLLIGLMLTLIITLNGCYSDDPKLNEKATEVPISSFSESEETIDSESATEVATEESDVITQEETEYSKDIAETDTTTVSATKETPKSNGTEKDNKPDSAKQPTEQPKSETKTSENQTQPVTQEPAKKTEPTELEKVVETVPNATKDDCKVIAQRVLEYINSYRGTPATKLSGLTEYAEYRSRQLVGNFAHSTDDERAAATALCYGEYVDPALYGMTGEPYYTAGAREAIVKTGYVGSVDKVAEKIALLVKNSSGHWNYVGSSDYSYIAVGVTYESGVWYCDIAMAMENSDNK